MIKSEAERDRRWAMARDLMADEALDALLVYGEHEGVPAAPFAHDNYFTNDRPGTIVMFCRDEDPIQLVWSPMHVEDHIEATKRGDELWIEPARIRVGKDATHVAAGMAAGYSRGAQPHILINTGPSVVSWGDAPWAHRPQQPQVIADGDVVLAEVLNAVARRETQSQVAIAVGDVHPDLEAAAQVARACYEAGLAQLVPDNTFGDVAEAMITTLKDAGGWNVHPMVHSLNPYGPVCGFGWGLKTYAPAKAYGELGEVPTVGAGLPLEPGMTFAFEPNCVLNGHLVNLGGTVVVGNDKPIELNTSTAHLLRR
ncbi:aminopeptidase P family protein [Kribbella sp. NBC_00482]|uniref:M24 family metallopeptidase n=1 Tax=Kribbella sp. NBC_00482 TaxID=2975968 RepID=UPI002E18563C